MSIILCLSILMSWFAIHADEPCCAPQNVINRTPCDTVLLQQRDRIDRNPNECVPCDLCKQACSSTNPALCQNDCVGKTIYIPRSVGANTARELVGWQNYIHLHDDENYASFALALGHARSFKPERLAQLLFGNTTINFAGSQVADRRNCEWLADYFGLPTHFRGRITFNPRITNTYLDAELFVGLDAVAPGFYLRMHSPLVHSTWHLELTECSNTGTFTAFPPCYMQNQPAIPAHTITQALSGLYVFGDMKTPRQFGNFDCRSRSRTRLADIDIIAGYDFIACPDYYVGLYTQVVIPTGNKPDVRYIFDPIVGNGHFWEIGLGIAGSALLWECPERYLRIYAEGNFTHLCQNRQLRSFDLCRNGLFSRYMLLKEFERDRITYSGNLISAINATTIPVDVSVPIKGDLSVKLAYSMGDFQADIGYNIYGRMREKLRACNDQINCNLGIKGTTGTCYFVYGTSGIPAEFGSLITTQSLNATESNATITRAGTIDNAQIPVTGVQTIATAWNNPRITGPASGTDIILAQTSQPPVLVTMRDLDLASGHACSFVTHKLFTFLSYTACNGFIGVGGEIEFEGLARNERSSLNQWSLFIKGGVSY
jgi:hypothetical protein